MGHAYERNPFTSRSFLCCAVLVVSRNTSPSAAFSGCCDTAWSNLTWEHNCCRYIKLLPLLPQNSGMCVHPLRLCTNCLPPCYDMSKVYTDACFEAAADCSNVIQEDETKSRTETNRLLQLSRIHVSSSVCILPTHRFSLRCVSEGAPVPSQNQTATQMIITVNLSTIATVVAATVTISATIDASIRVPTVYCYIVVTFQQTKEESAH